MTASWKTQETLTAVFNVIYSSTLGPVTLVTPAQGLPTCMPFHEWSSMASERGKQKMPMPRTCAQSISERIRFWLGAEGRRSVAKAHRCQT